MFSLDVFAYSVLLLLLFWMELPWPQTCLCALTLVDLFSYDQNMESEYCFKGLAVSASSLNVILDRLKNTFLEY